MNKDFKKEFKNCPVCSLRRWIIKLMNLPDKPPEANIRFFEDLANELKARGIARPQWNYALDSKQGVVADPEKLAGVPIGSELPGWAFETDICSECGMVYATKLERLKAHRTFEPSPHQKIVLPNLKQNS